MKKKIFSIIMIIFIPSICFTGCQKKQTETNNKTVEEVDTNTFEEKDIAPTKDGYYLSLDGILHFYDKDKNKMFPVCNKPDCTHELNQNCNADIVDLEDDMIQMSQNNLYIIGADVRDESDINDISLYQISPDATQRIKLYSLGSVQGVWNLQYIIYKEYIYYAFINPDEEAETGVTLARRKLEKGAKEEILYQEKGYGVSLYSFKAYGNGIYFDMSGSKKSDVEDSFAELKMYDISNGKTKTVWENGFGYYEKLGDNIYRFDYSTGQLVCFSEKQEKITPVIKVADISDCDLRTDGKYLYLLNFEKNEMEIVDTNGKTIAEMKDVPSELKGGDQDILLFVNKNNKYEIYDRNEALKGNMKKLWSQE